MVLTTFLSFFFNFTVFLWTIWEALSTSQIGLFFSSLLTDVYFGYCLSHFQELPLSDCPFLLAPGCVVAPLVLTLIRLL